MKAIINCTGDCQTPCTLQVPGIVAVAEHPKTSELHRINCMGEYFQGKVEALCWQLRKSEILKALSMTLTALIDKSCR